MTKYMVEINFKSIIIVGVWSILCTASIVSIVMWTHQASTREMKDKVNELATAMECKNNSCDRFKGKDAKEMEARLDAEIRKTRIECGCANGTTERK